MTLCSSHCSEVVGDIWAFCFCSCSEVTKYVPAKWVGQNLSYKMCTSQMAGTNLEVSQLMSGTLFRYVWTWVGTLKFCPSHLAGTHFVTYEHEQKQTVQMSPTSQVAFFHLLCSHEAPPSCIFPSFVQP